VTTPAPLATSITRSTLPASIVAGFAVPAAVVLDVTNVSANTLKSDKVTVEVFASTNGVIDNSSIELAHTPRLLNLKSRKFLPVGLPFPIAPATLPIGTYTVLTRVVEPSGNNDDSTTGPTLTVQTPVVSLSETISRTTIPASAAAGAKSRALVVVKISNGGNIITPGKTTVSLYASQSGFVDGAASRMNFVIPPLRIRPGKFALVVLPAKQIPAVAAGMYTILVQVIDANGGTSTVTSGVLNITSA
jgi:hypothetical protein